MKRLIEYVKAVAALVAVVSVVGGIFISADSRSVYLDYSAYRQRFPNAAPWTYLFRGHR